MILFFLFGSCFYTLFFQNGKLSVKSGIDGDNVFLNIWKPFDDQNSLF